jgi:hypothetical protein
MKNIIILLIATAFLYSCKRGLSSEKNVIIKQNDTIKVNCKKCIIDFKFNSEKLDILKNEYSEDDFYIIADDANHYTYEANNFLKTKKNEVISIIMNKNTVLSFEDRIFMSYSDINYWDFIFYKTLNKPLIVSPIDVEESYYDYFDRDKFNTSIDKKWHGKYSYKTAPYKLDSLSSIPIYYDISIKKDSVTFSGQGYKTIFSDLCYTKQNTDTLELYYNKTLEGTDYNKNEKGAIAKLYKKKDAIFIISPVIEDGEIQKDIPVIIQKER